MSRAVGNVIKIDYSDLYRYLVSTGTTLVFLSYIGIFGYLTAAYTVTETTQGGHIVLLGLPMVLGIVCICVSIFGFRETDGWLSRQATEDDKHEAHRDYIQKQVNAFENQSEPQLPSDISDNMETWEEENK